MIANLPLLFAGGHPTALSKITTPQLERFISFMVTCSWGHDTAKDIKQPPWWPADVPFAHPFRRAASARADWAERLRQLVRRCYDYHKSKFLLVFSAQLARYPHHKLRYVDNLDHTTSLYYRPSGKLLVTFRNENINYDRKTDAQSVKKEEPQLKPADIYLCDNCDSHFDNLDILKAHERLCNSEVIPSAPIINGGLPEFLSALKLRPACEKEETTTAIETVPKLRISRSSVISDRGPPYPFSSIAYMRNAKPSSQRDNTYSRERTERYCCDTPIASKLGNKCKGNQFPVKYRRPIDYWHRKHVFPEQRNKVVLDLEGQLLLLKCRPISVDVKQMSEQSMNEYMDKLNEEAKLKAESAEDIEFVGGFDCDQVMDVEHVVPDPLTAAQECEVIDLCSDEEGGGVGDPRAGVACVMRGGAVLRRAAASSPPRGATPSAPSGARQRPLPAVLLPHPVLLFTQSLSNIQTISID